MSAQPRQRLCPPAFDGAHTKWAGKPIIRFVNRTPGAPAPPVDDRPAHALVEARGTTLRHRQPSHCHGKSHAIDRDGVAWAS